MAHIATDEFIELFKEYPSRSQEESSDPLVVAKLFDTFGSATWYLTELNVEEMIAFGYVTGMAYDEWGYVSITELEEIMHSTLGVPRIEQDIYFPHQAFSKCVDRD